MRICCIHLLFDSIFITIIITLCVCVRGLVPAKQNKNKKKKKQFIENNGKSRTEISELFQC